MINFTSIRNWFSNSEHESNMDLECNSNTSFILKIGNLPIANLTHQNNCWTFQYTEAFRTQNKYSRMTGFSKLDKTYTNQTLWPFFKIRIPGLKQPMVKEILEAENIDKNDEVSLLKRFGNRTTSNPYILEYV